MNAEKQKALDELEALTKPVSQKAAANAMKQPGSIIEDDFIDDTVIAPPKPTDNMFYGFMGDIALVASEGTEINPVAAMTVFLSFLSANCGRDSFVLINNTYHHPRLFTLHVGRSGRGGKGDSQQLTHRIRKKLELSHAGLLGLTHTGGLSTREGLAALIPDSHGDNNGTDDKRLWIVESEFANVLHQSRREGNTLSTGLRDAWDGSDIKPATKSRAVVCSSPHIGLHANITPQEYKAMLNSKEISNGFANRFLTIYSENIGLVAFPKPTPDNVIDSLAEKTAEIIRYALGGYPASINGLQMHLSEAAKDCYTTLYPRLRAPFDSDIIGALLERRAPYALRLAMLFALTDLTHVIEPRHLSAAMAWINYAIASVNYVFADQAVSPQVLETKSHAQKIVEFLGKRPFGAGLRELNNDCFKKNTSGEKIKNALAFLLSENPPLIEQIEAQKQVKGRPKNIYRCKKGTDKTDKIQSHERRGLQAVL